VAHRECLFQNLIIYFIPFVDGPAGQRFTEPRPGRGNFDRGPEAGRTLRPVGGDERNEMKKKERKEAYGFFFRPGLDLGGGAMAWACRILAGFERLCPLAEGAALSGRGSASRTCPHSDRHFYGCS